MEGEFSSVSTPELVSEITTLAGHLNAGNARFLALIAELDRRQRLGGGGREVLRALAELEVRDRAGRGAREGPSGAGARDAAAGGGGDGRRPSQLLQGRGR